MYKKLTARDVEDIRDMYWSARNKAGMQAELTRMYDVHSSTICKIINMQSWRDVVSVNQLLYKWKRA
jgi:hypothetical protein